MSSGKRPGSDLKSTLGGTLGTLIRNTLEQVGVVTDAARQTARSGQRRIDAALLERRLRSAQADLGALIHELAVAGRLGQIESLPEVGDAIARIDELEERIAQDTGIDGDDGGGARPGSPRAAWERVPRTSAGAPRGRDRDRAADRTVEDGRAASDVWRPSTSGFGAGFDAGPDPDADLTDYMHADDVPPKRPT